MLSLELTNASPPSIGRSSVLALLAYLEQYGFDRQELAVQAGIDLSVLDDAEGRLELAAYRRLWVLACQLTGNPALGLELGRHSDQAQIGLVGHVFFNSPTLGEALAHYVRLYPLVNDAIRLHLVTDARFGYLQFVHLYPEHYCIPDMERSMVLAICRARAHVSQVLRLPSVHFQHAEPAYARDYQRLFACPVQFDADCCQIVFDKQLLDAPIHGSNPYLGSAALQYANSLVGRLLRHSLSEQVKALIYRNMGAGQADIESIARQLNMSRQTLYRKLKLEGGSFQGLLETVRCSRALQMLRGSGRSLSEIALALDFSELSAFSRAFKRWTGTSPRAYRETLTI